MNKGKAGKIAGKTVLGIFVLIAVVVQFYPLFWIFASSLKQTKSFL